MLIKRRKFLQTGSFVAASFMVPRFLKAFSPITAAQLPQGNKVVVVIQLSGGNDGLNTVIPVRNDIYYKQRPRLGINKSKALMLSDDAGLHPSLETFKGLYDEGSLAIMSDVGYPDPDRSHFRSMDIWQTASATNEYITTGWLGRYLDEECKICSQPTQVLEIDDILSLALKGQERKGIAFKDPRRLYNLSQAKYFKELSDVHHAAEHERPVDYLYKTMRETLSSADYIYEQSKLHPSSVVYPDTEIGRNLKIIASLISSDINTKIYYVSLGSFDTHVFQQQQQQRLFKELDDAIAAFIKDLKNSNRFNDLLLFTFSEFGRRVSQNASGGTDHGTANNMFFIGGSLKQQGLLNEMPDLNVLEDGDLKYKIDFKNVYSTILDKWLAADAEKILGKKFESLSFI
jgi:uncharacterized protein (DUF1501 family)